jgi:RsiW-degrading membrane proteinase PrsW (M82 family)
VGMTTQRLGMPAQSPPQPARARRWAWLPVLLVGIGLFIAVQRALVITGNPTLVPTLLVLGALLVPVSFVVYVDGRNPAHDLPLSVLLSCALLGGALGASVASVLEFDTVQRLGELPTLFIGLIEEAAKLLVPVTILIFTRYRANPADGLLIGVAVGMGFAALETLGYGFVVLLAHGGGLIDAESCSCCVGCSARRDTPPGLVWPLRRCGVPMPGDGGHVRWPPRSESSALS